MSDTESILSNEGGVGLADADLSQRRRQLLDLINRLHSTGAQVDIDLPQIAVIGSQSAGKSSLIESISGITLPRAAGTCTRCPTECRLANSTGTWKCVVSLRFIKDASGQLLGTARNEQFGEIITDKGDVEERIRRAQRAILNPNKRAADFLDGDDEDMLDNQLSFSANCVSLQITGPGVADLSFCDLPGLIASTGSAGNDGDIILVKSLVESYISKPSCLILLTVACETDFENQGAHNLAKQHDPLGKRTIGVLTKPDRIPSGEEDGWLSFIRGEKEALDNNWYCVKQPSSTEIKNGITWNDARRREDEFFSTVSPWAGLDSIYQRYLRTPNLVERLSHILSDLISKRLPDIRIEIERAIDKTLGQVNALPKAPSGNPLQEVSYLLSEFARDVSRHVEGVSDEDGIIQKFRTAHDEFKDAIHQTAPAFRPYSQERGSSTTWQIPSFLGSGEAQVLDTKQCDVVFIEEVNERAIRARTRELPGSFPFVVKEAYISRFVGHWHHPAKLLCRKIFAVLSSAMDKLVTEHFGSFGQKKLEQRVRLCIHESLKSRLEATETKLEWIINIEERPYTLNTHYLADYKQKFLNHYRTVRQRTEHSDVADVLGSYDDSSQNEDVRDILGKCSSIGIHGIKAADLGALLPHDEMEAALEIMADVRAYFQVAYKRYIDNVPLAIDHDLVRGLDRGLLLTLCERLGIHGPEGHKICQELAQESPQVADRREELNNKLERLQTAYMELMNSS